MISSQYGTEFTKSHYEKIKKVYSIWICMTPPKKRENSITQYSISENNLYGSVKEPVENYDLMTIVMICLGNADKNQNRLLYLLNILFSTDININEKKQILEQEFDIPIFEQLERSLDNMCNFSKGVWEKAIKKGLEEGMEKGIEAGMEKGIEAGMEKGIEAGMEKGIEKGILSSIKNLMESMGWSAEQAMDALKIPSSKKLEYSAKL